MLGGILTSVTNIADKQQEMNQSPYFYNLYCLDMNCKQSIYLNSVVTKAVFNLENLAATHLCTCCGQLLSSAMDIEIRQVTAEAGIVSGKPYHNSSH